MKNRLTILLLFFLLGTPYPGNTNDSASTFDFRTGILHIPVLNVVELGAFEVSILLSGSSPPELVLQDAVPTMATVPVPAVATLATGIIHIPQVTATGEQGFIGLFEVDLALIAGSTPFRFSVDRIAAIPQNFAITPGTWRGPTNDLCFNVAQDGSTLTNQNSSCFQAAPSRLRCALVVVLPSDISFCQVGSVLIEDNAFAIGTLVTGTFTSATSATGFLSSFGGSETIPWTASPNTQ